MTNERLERKMRASNMELLRIIAMFFVLLIHANFWAVLPPTVDEIVQNPVDAWIRTFFESAGGYSSALFYFYIRLVRNKFQTERASEFSVSKYFLPCGCYSHHVDAWNMWFG